MLTDDMAEVFVISGHTVQSVRQELRSATVSVCVCARACPHIYCILNTKILILLAKRGHVSELRPFC